MSPTPISFRSSQRGAESSVSEESQAVIPFSDTELLALFRREPEKAWQLFTHKYSDLVFSCLQRLGFDYDEAMDRFVYVFEKLYEQDYRRMKSIRHAGTHGDITPWLVQVVERFSISWLRSIEGRKRMLKPITKLPQHDQRVFELYFWKGCYPSLIAEQLQAHGHNTTLAEVLDSLDRIFSVLTEKKRWRLFSNLLKRSRTTPIDGEESRQEVVDSSLNPQDRILEKEAAHRLQQAIRELPPAPVTRIIVASLMKCELSTLKPLL